MGRGRRSAPRRLIVVARRYLFTLDTANRTLPFVRSIVASAAEDLAQLERCDVERRDREVTYEAGAFTARVAGGLEIVDDNLGVRIARAREELEELGLEACDLVTGHVDFPTREQGRPACLCWRLGDGRVEHWHRPGEDVAQRRRAE